MHCFEPVEAHRLKDDAVQITKDAEILEPQDWSFPVPIAYGPGRLSEIGKMCRTLGVTRPLIVTDRGSQNLPFISQLEDLKPRKLKKLFKQIKKELKSVGLEIPEELTLEDVLDELQNHCPMLFAELIN